MPTVQNLREILGDVLQLGERANSLTETSALFGSIPEFDSMAVVTVVAALEERFGIIVDDDDITAEVFESVGSLAQFVDDKLAA